MYDDPTELNHDIDQVAGLLIDAADDFLPHVQSRRKRGWRDDTLTRLCAQSRAARAAWIGAGRPDEGPLFDEKGRLRRAVRKRVRFCAARSERLRMQRRDRMFATKDWGRFRTPQTRKSRCSKLVVDGEIVQDPEALLHVWVQHFQKLSKSKEESTPGLCGLRKMVELLETQSHMHEELLLDEPFMVDEVTRAIARLKCRKTAEHLKAGGQTVVIWLWRLLNAVVELEVASDVLKRGLVVPVYKGGGKDPLKVDSYRGVTLTSVIAKVFLFLERLEFVFAEAGIPHLNQSAYRKAVSCADAIFATQENIAKYLRGGSRTCAHVLIRPAESVELCGIPGAFGRNV